MIHVFVTFRNYKIWIENLLHIIYQTIITLDSAPSVSFKSIVETLQCMILMICLIWKFRTKKYFSTILSSSVDCFFLRCWGEWKLNLSHSNKLLFFNFFFSIWICRCVTVKDVQLGLLSQNWKPISYLKYSSGAQYTIGW